MTTNKMIKGIGFIVLIFLTIKWILSPLDYKPDYSKNFRKLKEEVQKTFDEYDEILNRYKINETISYNERCYINLTRTNFPSNFTMLIKPLTKSYDECYRLKRMVETKNYDSKLSEKEFMNKYHIYLKNDIEILTSNDTVNICGNINKINNIQDNIYNFDIDDYDLNKNYNLSFYLDHTNNTLTFLQQYKNNICNYLF